MDDKEFWERCGFSIPIDPDTKIELAGWINPNGDRVRQLPLMDLNNLFQYAVDLEDMVHFYPWEGAICCSYAPKGNLVKARTGVGETHALALRAARERVFEDEDKGTQETRG